MYCLGFPKILNDSEPEKGKVICIRASRDRSFFAAVYQRAVSIWYYRPHVSLVSYVRGDESVEEFGCNQDVAWRPDGFMLAVVTTRSRVIFYKLQLTDNEIYVSNPVKSSRITEDTPHIQNIPEVTLEQTCIVPLVGGISCISSRREELVVATGNGMLCQMCWDGSVNGQLSLQVHAIPFTADPQRVRAVPLASSAGLYLSAIEYCSKLGGFAFVLNNGRGGLLISTSLGFDPKHVKGIWARGVTNAGCLAVNQRYGLIAFGCDSGDVLLYTLDDLTGSLLHSHSMSLSPQQYPDAALHSGPVHSMAWTPDGSALMVSWCRGGFSLWTTFGALLLCSLHGDYGISVDSIDFSQSLVIKSMAWGAEGYHLLMVSETSHEDQRGSASQGDIVVLQFAKTALLNNPTGTNHEYVLLQAEDRLYLHTADNLAYKQGDSLSAADSRQWQIVQIPLNYLLTNWPIKYVAVDKTGQYVAVSGRRGVAHCHVSTKKWKLFGNESQEQAITVRGGIAWWKDIIIFGCHNHVGEPDEVRMYSRSTRLDNQLMSHLIKLASPVVVTNVFRDFLLVLTTERTLYLYGMERQAGPNILSGLAPVVILAKLLEISIAQYVPHISSLISLEPSALRTEAAGSSPTSKGLPESIIANVAGKLLLLQRDHSVPERKGKQTQFLAPVVLASCVEHVWASAHSKPSHRYLLEALWLGCGAGGMKVWLPLFPRDGQHGSNFLSKRIMLTFRLEIYPLSNQLYVIW
jgi:WD40 repeat protein